MEDGVFNRQRTVIAGRYHRTCILGIRQRRPCRPCARRGQRQARDTRVVEREPLREGVALTCRQGDGHRTGQSVRIVEGTRGGIARNQVREILGARAVRHHNVLPKHFPEPDKDHHHC